MRTNHAIIGLAALIASGTSLAGLEGPYAPSNWTTTGIADGTTAIYPSPLGSIDLSHEVDLGNPGEGVPFSEANFSVIAPDDGIVSFDWNWTGFAAFFQSSGGLQLFADGPDGTEVINLSDFQDIPAEFDLSGTGSIEVHKGFAWGIIASGQNLDSNSVFEGTVRLSNLLVLPVDTADAMNASNWGTTGVADGSASIAPDSGSTDLLTLNYEVDLGNPGPGVSERSVTFSSVAAADDVVRFNWTWEGFHAFFQSFGGLQLFADGPEGMVVFDIIEYQDVPSEFSFDGTVAIQVSEGFEYGLIVTGENSDSNSQLTGELVLDFAHARDFSQKLNPSMWSIEAPELGDAQATPVLQDTGALGLWYDVSLGNPGPGVTYRSTAYSVVAAGSGEASFEWAWAGFHAFASSFGELQLFADGPDGTELIDLVAFQDVPAPFEFTGSASLEVHDGYSFGIIAGGQNFDSNSNIFGEIVIGAFEAPLPPVCEGDANGDQAVDSTDLNAVLGSFGDAVDPGTSGDVNGDGVVDSLDLNGVLANFGTGC